MSSHRPSKVVSFRLEESTIQNLDRIASFNLGRTRTFVLSYLLKAVFRDLTDREILQLVHLAYRRSESPLKLALVPNDKMEDKK